jgi:predicted DCC family thiol-disulfide oxidoreductase YuxK
MHLELNSEETRAPAVPVLLFDGECGLCNRVVRLLLRLDQAGRLKFAPLQGAAAQAYLRSHGLPGSDFDSLVYVPDWNRKAHGEYLLRTDGVMAALRLIGRAGRVFLWIRFIPTSWRDAGYRVVARWRYRFFGKWHPRPLAHPEWAARFLD